MGIIGEKLIFMYCCLVFVSHFFHRVKFFSGCFRQVFFHWETKVITGRIRQVVILYSNNCMGI